jgi:hypothetical protein
MRFGSVRTGLSTAAAAVVLGSGLVAIPLLNSGAPVSAASASSTVAAPTFPIALQAVAQVNLTQLAQSAAHKTVAVSPQGAALTGSTSSPYRSVDNSVVTHKPLGTSTTAPNPASTPITNTNVNGEYGFVGLTGV